MAFSADGTRVITSGRDFSARVWSTADAALAYRLVGHGDRVTDAFFSADCTYAGTLSDDRAVGLWDAATGALLRVLQHGARPTLARFSRDGARLLTSDGDQLRMWDLAPDPRPPDAIHDDVVALRSPLGSSAARDPPETR